MENEIKDVESEENKIKEAFKFLDEVKRLNEINSEEKWLPVCVFNFMVDSAERLGIVKKLFKEVLSDKDNVNNELRRDNAKLREALSVISKNGYFGNDINAVSDYAKRMLETVYGNND